MLRFVSQVLSNKYISIIRLIFMSVYEYVNLVTVSAYGNNVHS